MTAGWRTSPTLPLTLLEASWLKALLADARIRLFLSDDSFQHLSKELADVEPLYRQEDFLCFDRYLDGDPYADEDYRRRFQAILAAMRERAALSIAYTPPKGRRTTASISPCSWSIPPRTINSACLPPRCGTAGCAGISA